jgi:hypothetical protein
MTPTPEEAPREAKRPQSLEGLLYDLDLLPEQCGTHREIFLCATITNHVVGLELRLAKADAYAVGLMQGADSLRDDNKRLRIDLKLAQDIAKDSKGVDQSIQAVELDKVKAELEEWRSGKRHRTNPSLDAALNEGDGSYKP